MNINLCTLQHFDTLHPSQKLRFLAATDTHQAEALLKECDSIVVAMHALDEVLREQSGNEYFYYFQDDQSVINVFELVDLPLVMHDRSFAALGVSQHLYRFNVAKKFGLPSEAKQLRLNSWGREHLIDAKLLDSEAVLHRSVKHRFKEYFNLHAAVYQSLIDLLLKKLTPDNALEIRELNQSLKVKILS